jgi:hypothetical protein
MATPNPQQHADALNLLAFYEIARLAHLTEHPDLIQLPAFLQAKALFQARAEYFREGFGKPEAIDDYLKLRLEGALTSQNKSWEDVWAEFAPASLKRFPLAPGSL